MTSPCPLAGTPDIAQADQYGRSVPEAEQDWPLRTYLELGALPGAVPCARLHVKHVLWEWGLHEIAETAELLVSELITNGVKAARALPHRPPVWLRLSATTGRVLIEVGDGNPEPPEPRALEDGLPDFGQESGRGLFLVDSLSEQWNWYPAQNVVGKVVWCLLAVPQPETSEQREAVALPPLPKRVRSSGPARSAQPAAAPEVLWRVLDGLLGLEADSG